MRSTPVVLLVSLWLAACEQPQQTALDRIREDGFIRAAYSSEPPYAFLDRAGVVRGESPLALKAVAQAIGIEEIKWVRAEFPNLIPLLRQGRVDVVAAGLFDTPERTALVRFSVPTICAAPALIVRRGSEHTSLEHVAYHPAARLAVLGESVENRVANMLNVEPEKLLVVPDVRTGIAAVAEGVADAMAVTLPTARFAISAASETNLEVRSYDPKPQIANLLSGCSALAFRLQDDSLLDAADRALSVYIGSAEHRDSLSVLGFTDDDLPAGTQ